MVSEGLQLPDCENVTVTDYLLLAPNSSFGRLEVELCTANWTAIAMAMTSVPQAQPVVDALDDLTAQVLEVISCCDASVCSPTCLYVCVWLCCPTSLTVCKSISVKSSFFSLSSFCTLQHFSFSVEEVWE